MSTCPNYYRTSDGREFWEWYRAECTPITKNTLDQDQAHALQSAAEYIFRAGRKTPSPVDDFRKASSLIERVVGLAKDKIDQEMVKVVVSRVVGLVVMEKMAAEIAEKPKTVDLTDPIVTAWGAFTR